MCNVGRSYKDLADLPLLLLYFQIIILVKSYSRQRSPRMLLALFVFEFRDV